MEQKENNCDSCCCECCHCKKIFMLLVLLILAFIAGIMVGHCQNTYPNYMGNYTPHIIKTKAMHRGAAPQRSDKNSAASASQNEPTAQIGGYIIEIDQAQ